MTNTISLSTQTFKKVKLVEIDGIPFKVRRFGAGEQLTVMQLQRKMKELSSLPSMTDEQENSVVDLSQSLLEIVSNLFDDMGTGAETKKLIQRIDLDDLQLMLGQIFNDTSDDGSEAEIS